MCNPIVIVKIKMFGRKQSPLEHRSMKKQQLIIPFGLVLILITGLAGCKSSENSSSSEQPQTEQASTPSSENNTEGKKTRSPEAQKRREEIRNQIKAVLTPEQVKQLDSKMQAGEKMRQVLISLNLTADQKMKIEAIYKTARANRQAESPSN
jgi:Spy/CpxP family protein refolding chaperone